MLTAVLLALFPFVLMFDTRFGAATLLVAIGLLFRKRTVRRRPPIRHLPPVERTTWKDPWKTGGLD